MHLLLIDTSHERNKHGEYGRTVQSLSHFKFAADEVSCTFRRCIMCILLGLGEGKRAKGATLVSGQYGRCKRLSQRERERERDLLEIRKSMEMHLTGQKVHVCRNFTLSCPSNKHLALCKHIFCQTD